MDSPQPPRFKPWTPAVLSLLLGGCATPQTATPQAQPQPHSLAPRPTPAAPTTQPLDETVIDLGHSVEGRPIRLHVLGHASDAWPTLILAAFHGNEPTCAKLATSLIELLRRQPQLLGHRKVAIIPVANPDGLERRLRTNKNLVDLNRNFPASNWTKARKGVYFGGDRPASEPETLAIMKAFDVVKPARVISIHSMDNPCNNYDAPGRNLAQLFARANQYPVKDNIGYPTPGSLGSWGGIDRRVPIITLELPRRQEGQAAWRQNKDALLAVIRAGESFPPVPQATADATR
jgi:protein MpaA